MDQGSVVDVRVHRPDGSAFLRSLDPRVDNPRLRPTTNDGRLMACGFEVGLLEVVPDRSALLALVPLHEARRTPRRVAVPDEPGETVELYVDPRFDALRAYAPGGDPGRAVHRGFDTPPSVLGELGRPLGICAMGVGGPGELTPETLTWGEGRFEIRADLLPGGGSGCGEGYVLFDHRTRTWLRLFAGTTGTVLEACGLLVDGRLLAPRMDSDTAWPDRVVELVDDGVRIHPVPMAAITKLFSEAHVELFGGASQAPAPRYTLRQLELSGTPSALRLIVDAIRLDGSPVRGTFLVRNGRLKESSVDLLND